MNEMIISGFNEKLIEFRKSHALSQNGMAEWIGVLQPDISNFENKAYQRLSIKSLARIFDFLGYVLSVVYNPDGSKEIRVEQKSAQSTTPLTTPLTTPGAPYAE